MLFLLALLLGVAVPAQAQPTDPEAPSECVAARDSLRAAHREYQQGAEVLDALSRTGRALRECAGAPVTWRISGLSWEIFGLMQRGHYEEAEPLLDRLLSTYRADADTLNLVLAHSRRAMLRSRRGEPLAALGDYRAALALSDQLPPDRRARLLLDLSTHYGRLGDRDRALQAVQEATLLLDPNEPNAELVRVLYRQSALKVAAARRAAPEDEVALQDALALARRSLAVLDSGPVADVRRQRQLRAHALSAVYGALMKLERFAEALAPAAEALRLAREDGTRGLVVQMIDSYAAVLIELHRTDEALAVLAEGMAMAEEEGRRSSLYHRMAEAHRVAGRTAAAESAYRDAIDALEEHRSAVAGAEWSALGNRMAYYRLVSLLLEQGRWAEAFEWFDAARARHLRDVRQQGGTHALPPAARSRLDSLRAVQRSARAALQGGAAQNGTTLELQIAHLEAEIAALVGSEAPLLRPSLRELQAAVGQRGGAVLAYFVPHAWREDPSYVFVLTGDAFHAVPLSVQAGELDVLVRQAGLMGDNSVTPVSFSVEAAPLRGLYEALFRPVERLIPAGTPVTVIPDGAVAHVPFGMLLTRDAARFQYHKWPFLIRRHAFSTELAVALLDAPPAPRGSVPLAAFGRSTYKGRSAPPPFEDQRLGPLPYVPSELSALRRHVPRARIALDDAIRQADLLAMLPDVQVLHLASHAFVHPENPLYSSIVLFDLEDDDDGALFLYELIGRDVGAELVVLSACQTASGRRVGAEGFVGLQYAFRAAGARSSLSMRWQVDDAATVFLMDRFYRHLRRGLPKDRAIQQAQLDYLASHTRLQASPFFWAAADLAGDVTPVAWPPRGLPPLAWTLLGLVLVIGAVAAGRWRRV